MDGHEGSASRLRAKFAAVTFPLHPTVRLRLRQEVSDYVDELKALGWQPGRVLITVKQVAHDAGLRPVARVVHIDSQISESDTLLAEIVRWSIEHYYMKDESAP